MLPAMATKGSEYGGINGRIAPLPHELDGYEQARLMRKMDTYVPPGGTPVIGSVEEARLAEAIEEGRGSIANPDGFDGRP